MHYIIDGYNLLFRLLNNPKPLSEKRLQIIQDLNKKIKLLGLDVTVVFDSNAQLGESLKSHYNSIEIQFTKKGVSADDWIIRLVERASHPTQKMIVTSDKKLAALARQCGGKTESVEEFVQHLNMRIKNKLRNTKSDKETETKREKIVLKTPLQNKEKNKLLIKTSPSELKHDIDYYLKIFEDSFKSQEKPKKSSPKPKEPKHLFPKVKKEEVKELSDMERWLKAFESDS